MAKVDINASLARQLLAGQFPVWADLPIRRIAEDGVDNRTFRLGEEMAVRLPSAECYSQQVEKEQRWLPKLGPLLPLAVPFPLAMGMPGNGYPWRWSVYRWLDGETASMERVNDPNAFAIALARFLSAMQEVDPTDGPEPGRHNFFRGGPLSTYDGEARSAIASLHNTFDMDGGTALWEAALKATWHGSPVWFHGDVSATNLLVREGELSAVIDFGCMGVGDPACDLTIAWTLFAGDSRETFRRCVGADEATWARARGWALWKAVITLYEVESDATLYEKRRQVIDDLLLEHRQAA